MRPASGLRSPVIASMSSVCPLPSTPAIPTISPLVHLEGDASHLLDPPLVADVETVDLEQGLARRGAPSSRPQQHLATDHQLGEALLGRPGGGQRLDELAAPQDGDAVGDLEHLVQLVADEDDRHALAYEGLEDPEELLASWGVSTAVGSSRIRMSACR